MTPDPLEFYKQLAKTLLRAIRDGDAQAKERVRKNHHKFASSASFDGFRLADAQYVLAREQGHPSWSKLKMDLESRPSVHATPYETSLALVKSEAFRADPEGSLRMAHPVLKTQYGHLLKEILSHVRKDPQLLKPEFAERWDIILDELLYPLEDSDFESLSESD